MVAVATLDTDGNPARVNWTAGTFAFTGAAGFSLSSSGPLGSSLNIPVNKTLLVSNTFTIASDGLANLAGGTISAGSIDFGSDPTRLNWTKGTLSITGPAGLIVGLDGQLGAILNIPSIGTLNVTNTLTNAGVINVPALATVHPGTLINTGAINLTGGALTGGGVLTNSPGGVISGGGNIQMQIAPAGGMLIASNPAIPLNILSTMSANSSSSQIIVAANSAMNFQSGFSNAGVINVQGGLAFLSLASGSISNTGTIRGSGDINAPIANSGIIRPENGDLLLAAAGNLNNPTGQLIVSTSNTLLFGSGLSINAGNIQLTGGVFDNNALPMSNTGTIAGQGTIRSR